jgi:hypothetical protein
LTAVQTFTGSVGAVGFSIVWIGMTTLPTKRSELGPGLFAVLKKPPTTHGGTSQYTSRPSGDCVPSNVALAELVVPVDALETSKSVPAPYAAEPLFGVTFVVPLSPSDSLHIVPR